MSSRKFFLDDETYRKMNNGRSDKQRFGCEAISSQIQVIERLYSQANISINDTHSLLSLLNHAKHIVSEWRKGDFENKDMLKVFSTLHIQRIAAGIECLVSESNREKYLKDLLKGSLNFFDRDLSHAKSIFWELEAFTKIKKVIPSSKLEEPDIVTYIDDFSIAVPCKKIFSVKGVPKVLSNAVKQIERDHDFGIVAMNIDDLLPGGMVCNAHTFHDAGDKLHNRNIKFLHKHARHFLRYLSASRIIGVVAATSIVTNIHSEAPKFNNYSQWAIWTIPDLKKEHSRAIDEFRQKVIG